MDLLPHVVRADRYRRDKAECRDMDTQAGGETCHDDA